MLWTHIQSMLCSLFRKARVEHELDEEVRSCVEEAVHDKIERGGWTSLVRRGA